MLFSSFLDKPFRVSSFFQLLEWNQLSIEQQQLLSDLYDSDDVYGIFQPASASRQRTPKVAYRDAAFLYLHLQQSPQLPRCFLTGDHGQLKTVLAQLVLDDVLFVENSGVFVSGQKAVPVLYNHWIEKNEVPLHHTSLLSLKAIAYAFRLYGLSASEMAGRLYTFNTAANENSAKASDPSTNTIAFLLSGAPEMLHEQLTAYWQFTPPFSGYDWFSWHRKDDFCFTQKELVYKLYLSPVTSQLPTLFQKALPVLTGSSAYGFKIGAGASGASRPDKMLVYFESHQALLETAASLARTLRGFSVQGVPFTAQLDEDGLLSWGVDPPQPDVPEALAGGSWRTTVTSQLAQAILQAQNQNLSWDEALPFLRAKLFAAGISMNHWRPLETAEAFVTENSFTHG